MFQLKIKVLKSNIVLPTRAHSDDAGLDLCCPYSVIFNSQEQHIVRLGFATEFSPALVAIIKDRSSIAARGITCLGGVIDSNYRGEWKLIMKNLDHEKQYLSEGDKIAQVIFQLVVRPLVEVVSELNESSRMGGGFGSTD